MRCNNLYRFSSQLYYHPRLYFRFFSKCVECQSCNLDSCKECWKCHNMRQIDDIFFCSKCGTIQKPDNELNYFKLFSINPQPVYDLDLSKLDQKYKYLMSKLHPDKFSTKKDEEAKLSFEQSTVITKAYQTLKDPNERAKYLLKILDLDLNDARLSFDFLSNMMNKIEEAELETDVPRLMHMKEDIQKEIHNIESKIQVCLNRNDMQGILANVAELSYLNRVYNTIYEKVDVV